jgi:septal ring factor EnvC (AmiA/AmiB activator)
MPPDPNTVPPAPERTDEVTASHPAPPLPPPGPSFAEKAWGFAKELLVIAVIPGLVWVVNMERNNATRDANLNTVQTAIAELKESTGKQGDQIGALNNQVHIAQSATDIRAKIAENAVSIARIEGKIDRIDSAVARIEKLLGP